MKIDAQKTLLYRSPPNLAPAQLSCTICFVCRVWSLFTLNILTMISTPRPTQQQQQRHRIHIGSDHPHVPSSTNGQINSLSPRTMVTMRPHVNFLSKWYYLCQTKCEWLGRKNLLGSTRPTSAAAAAATKNQNRRWNETKKLEWNMVLSIELMGSHKQQQQLENDNPIEESQ